MSTPHPEPCIAAGFDYTTLDPVLAVEARAMAQRIRRRTLSFIADIGRDLISIKEKMPHGRFGRWIAGEFGMSDRTAQNYMNVSRFLKGKSATVSLLPPAALYALASPSAPAAAVNEVIAAIDGGNVMSATDIKTKLARPIEAKTVPEQSAIECIAQELDVKRARLVAGRLARKAKQAREEREWIDRFAPLAQRIGAAMGPQDIASLCEILSKSPRARIAASRLLKAEIQPVLL